MNKYYLVCFAVDHACIEQATVTYEYNGPADIHTKEGFEIILSVLNEQAQKKGYKEVIIVNWLKFS